MREKTFALFEAGSYFLLNAALFWALRLAPLGLNGGRQSMLVHYGVMLALNLALLSGIRPRLGEDPLSLNHLGVQSRVVGLAFFPVLILSSALSLVDWRSWPGALLIAVLALAATLVTAWLLRKQPAPAGGTLVSGLLLPAFGVALQQAGLGPALLNAALFYLFVAPAEEILFRGLIQTRLNGAFGRPFRLFGTAFGWGLPLTAVLFGLWHILLPGTGGWPQALWTACAGLLFGLARERSGGVFAPSLLHGVLNYSPLAFAAALFG